MQISAFARKQTASAIVTALAVLPTLALHAQSRPIRADTLSARARDSLIASVLEDTIVPPLRGSQHLSAVRQTVSIRPTWRTYHVGQIDANEQATATTFITRYQRATLRFAVTPVAYRGDTSTSASPPQVSFGGASPISGRLDLRVRSADTLRVFGQTASFPGTLTASDAQAVGAVGTSTIDLDAAILGSAARIGTRYALTQGVGAGVSLSLRGGVEYDPKPTSTQQVSWRGTTVRGGVGLSHASASTTIGASAEVTHSYTDSLGGRNLYPGGGALNVEARTFHTYGVERTGFVAVNAFYSKPIDIQRPDVPTRIIPIGDFMGVTTAMAVPLGPLTMLPTLTVLRESSQGETTVNGVKNTRKASGNTASLSLALLLPLGRHLSLTPEGGVAFGSVGQTTSAQYPLRPQRRTFSDTIRGNFFAIDFTVSR